MPWNNCGIRGGHEDGHDDCRISRIISQRLLKTHYTAVRSTSLSFLLSPGFTFYGWCIFLHETLRNLEVPTVCNNKAFEYTKQFSLNNLLGYWTLRLNVLRDRRWPSSDCNYIDKSLLGLSEEKLLLHRSLSKQSNCQRFAPQKNILTKISNYWLWVIRTSLLRGDTWHLPICSFLLMSEAPLFYWAHTHMVQ